MKSRPMKMSYVYTLSCRARLVLLGDRGTGRLPKRIIFTGRWLGLVAGVMLAFLTLGMPVSAQGEEPWWLSHPADPFPLNICVVLDAALEDETEVLDFDGREIRVCCQDCVGEFSDAFDTWITVVDEKIADQQKPLYPVNKCLVDGESLEEQGAIELVVYNRLFLLCSEDCCSAVKEDREKFFGLLNKAVIEKQKATYPLGECIVSGEPLGENSIDYVVGNQLVRLANEDQIEKFDERASAFLVELREQTKKNAAGASD